MINSAPDGSDLSIRTASGRKSSFIAIHFGATVPYSSDPTPITAAELIAR
jgi:hypothetical protein